MYVMISMAAYGAVTATTGIGGGCGGADAGLGSPARPHAAAGQRLRLMKAVVAVAVAAIPITLIYLLGLLTDAEGSFGAWLLSALVVLAGAAVFALYGLVFGLALRSEAAVSAASGSLVILAFMGNIFFPLSGSLLTLAKFTPLYGYVSLARYPVTRATCSTSPTARDPRSAVGAGG